MQNVLKQLNQKPIAYYPVYRQITGSTTAGILLSQLMYWFSKKDKFYKTNDELMQETLLTEKELKNAKRKIKKLDFIKVTKEGVPARTYYEIDWDKFIEVLQNSPTSWDERAQLDGPKGPNWLGPKGPTITKNTTKITTNIKEKIYKREKNKHLPKEDELQASDFQEIAEQYQVPISFVISKWDDVLNYCHAKDKRYKDYRRVLAMWVKKDALERREAYAKANNKHGIDARNI